ncbi:MAG: hypothetical protein WC142_01560 [Bacteroidales bacterium]|jgi:outer membrane protein assembly factor BamD (BamD/ComL family)|nr:hypothetical protein [Bacteroidales bacterium]MDD2687372.1 hypothetical protein [Bacteroidales bacterium]MDD3330282.1 hypothetical protein [Bacteroidales bacterium]MDD3690571.1 hypothetical protein [Bacteroidales bacterium]MDD4043874.1 hypothetical protein [Bacteroidales bacterium]
MKTMRLFVAYVACISVFVACGPSQTKLIKDITELETAIKEDLDTGKMSRLIGLYDTYVTNFTEDSLTEEYLFRAANVSRVLPNGELALKYYDLLIQKHPESVYLPETYFFKAVVYEEIMYDMGAAAFYYKEFIKKFPSHPMVQDAELSLKYLGKTPDEIVEMFKANEVSDTL